MIIKLDELESILNEMPVTILALTETWLPPEAVDSFHIPGYNFIHKSRGVVYGGVGMFIRKNIRFSALTNVKASDNHLFRSISRDQLDELSGSSVATSRIEFI